MEAKEWQDTVINPDRKDELINMATELTNPMPLLQVMKFADAVADEQAEISFPLGEQQGILKGRKEVVEWMKTKQLPDTPASEPYRGLVVISKVQVQAQLKVWFTPELLEKIDK